jgi:uncharacterized protein with HEPN domain
MSKRDYMIFIKDIYAEINRIKKFVSTLDSIDELEENDLVMYAVLKCFENIGEAAKHIPENVRLRYPYFWKEISGLRDVIIHNYWGIDLDVIKDIYQNELPELEKIVKTILEEDHA